MAMAMATAIHKITVVSASGADLAGQAVKISGSDVLQTNSQGVAQSLLGKETLLEIAVNRQPCWSGDTCVLARSLGKRSFGNCQQVLLGSAHINCS